MKKVNEKTRKEKKVQNWNMSDTETMWPEDNCHQQTSVLAALTLHSFFSWT